MAVGCYANRFFRVGNGTKQIQKNGAKKRNQKKPVHEMKGQKLNYDLKWNLNSN